MRQAVLDRRVVGNVLSEAVARHADAPAIFCSTTNRRFTFRELDARANRLAQALLAKGLKRGDILAFLVSNRAEIAEIYFALARTGIIGLPLSYRLTETELGALLGAMRPQALAYEARVGATVQRLRGALPQLDPIIRIGGGDTIGVDYEALLAGAPAQAPDIAIEPADPFYFNVTSGTTGTPKGFVLTHDNHTTLNVFFEAMDVTKRDVVMTVFPMFGRVGFGWVIGSVMYGVPNVFTNFEPADALRLIEEEGVTVVNMVPTMGSMVLAAQAAAPRDVSSLRAIIYAGSSLPESVREQTAESLCRDVYEFYGMNEMGALVVSNPGDRWRRPHSVGKPLSCSEVKIVDAQDHDALANQPGEVLGRTPMSAAAYFGDPEKSAATFCNGWVKTGDLGYLDEEGYLFLHGRKKDLIISGGQNVYPAEVEETILRHGGVADCAVFGLPDDLWGERVVSVVVPLPDATLTPANLDSFCRKNLAGFKVPKEFFLDTGPLPRTSTNKVQKFLLAERFGRLGARSPRP